MPFIGTLFLKGDKMIINFKNNWNDFLNTEFNKDYFKDLSKKVDEAYQNDICFPKSDEIFNAFKYCDLNDVKVVIIGQDPYHDFNQAHGLAFSVLNGVLPPSLKNIYKEIENEFGSVINCNGNLTNWANQGVFLLNRTLTVKAHQANSHKNFGWSEFTLNTIKYLGKTKKNVVYMLWGQDAINLQKYIDSKTNLVLTSPHPSPLSSYRGFFGNNHFKLCNEYLKSKEEKEVIW